MRQIISGCITVIAAGCCILLVSCRSLKADDLDQVSAKYREWMLGSPDLNYNDPQVALRYQAILAYVSEAHQLFDSFKWTPDKQFVFEGVKKNQNEAREIFKKILFPLSLGYNLKGAGSNDDYHNPGTQKKILFIYDYLHGKGFKPGLGMGYGHCDSYKKTGIPGFGGSMGNNLVGYSLSVFLNKDMLAEKNLLTRECATMDWISDIVGTKWSTEKLWSVNGFNSDAVRSMINNRLAWVLTLPADDVQREKETKHITALLDKALQVSDGWADLIRPDFTGWHHKNAYLNAYAPGAFHTAAMMTWLLEDTQYEISTSSKNNLAQGLLALRIYNQKYDVPRGGCGRFPDVTGTLYAHIPAYSYMSEVSHDHQQEIKGALSRLWDPSVEGFNMKALSGVDAGISYLGSLGALELTLNTVKGKAPESDPNGYWYFPYAGLTVYRQDNWMISHKGTSNFIWDFESGGNQNMYGRFLSSGVVQIYAGGDPVSSDGSGYKTDGINWSRMPAATTLDLPLDKIKRQHKKYHRHFTGKTFLGGVSFGQKKETLGLTGLDHKDPYSSAEFKQSLLVFDSYALVMGSDIKSKRETSPVQTTLFQLRDTDASTKFMTSAGSYSPAELAAGVSIESTPSNVTGLVDTQGHAYMVYSPAKLSVQQGKQKSKKQNSKTKSYGDFASARIDHGLNPQDASYVYLIKIRGGEKALDEMRIKQPFKILAHSTDQHIVQLPNKGTVAYTLFAAGKIQTDTNVSSIDTPALILEKAHSESLELAITNPYLGKFKPKHYNDIQGDLWHSSSTVQPVSITVKGAWQLTDTNEQVSIVSSTSNETTIKFDGFDGKPLVARFTPVK